MSPHSAPRILVVDDEPTILRALAMALTRGGYDPRIAESGATAQAYLKSEQFDAMIIDLRMPDVRGDELFEFAASLQPHLRDRTVFTTGDTSDRALDLIEACGCPLLPKPFDLADILAVIKSLTRRARESSA
ncbi:MAG: response regulator [Gemmatimonadota bacterium]|nr:response regulator [Gemmatimonadota bacterium]